MDGGCLRCAREDDQCAGEKGTTYTILVFDVAFDPPDEVNGGNLNLYIDFVDVTVARWGTVDRRTGSATLRGTIYCTDYVEVVSLRAALSQRIRRHTASGAGFLVPECDGIRRTWELEILPDSRRFRVGPAAVVTNASVCTEYGCGFDIVESKLVMLPSRRG